MPYLLCDWKDRYHICRGYSHIYMLHLPLSETSQLSQIGFSLAAAFGRGDVLGVHGGLVPDLPSRSDDDHEERGLFRGRGGSHHQHLQVPRRQ